jgi:hypothetical protein
MLDIVRFLTGLPLAADSMFRCCHAATVVEVVAQAARYSNEGRTQQSEAAAAAPTCQTLAVVVAGCKTF